MDDMTNFIYIAMGVLFAWSLWNFRGTGLLRLMGVGHQLRKAARKLSDPDTGSALRGQILRGEENACEGLFQGKVLTHQMRLYCLDARKNHVTSYDKCQCEIGDYFNDTLLEQQGNLAFAEHAASGMTALGILGTFVGMAFGLTGFQTETSEQVMNGISGLLEGMSFAFDTSIVGILLSLALGTITRSIRSSAETHLDAFLDNFRENVLSNQKEAALNQLLSRISTVEERISANTDHQMQMLGEMADQFVLRMGQDLQLQVDDMRSALQGTTREQRAYANTIHDLTRGVADLGTQMNSMSQSFLPVVAQCQAMADQIARANQTLQQQMRDIDTFLTGSAQILEQQANMVENLNRYADSLQAVTAGLVQQTQDSAQAAKTVAQCSSDIVRDTQRAMAVQLQEMLQASDEFQQSLRQQNQAHLSALADDARQILLQAPGGENNGEQLDLLISQNAQMIENQQLILEALTQTKKVRKTVWRRKDT